jgi:TolB-like protein/class 3 adenylate cyclase/Tfp pilus assembly protein PilF
MAREQRRLAAIVAADVVGYSRMMGRDEAGTLALLREHRKQRLEPSLARHGGRLVKLAGDGAIVEFGSAVEALSAAIEFQQSMRDANAGQPEDSAIVFRVGLHLGDLIVDGDDLYGDGVNVAARLEAEAEPGSIVISGDLHNAVAGRLKASFRDLGDLTLKHIERPVRAFQALWNSPDWQVETVAADPSSVPAARDVPVSAVPLALPDKPSIAVLPFQNISGDAEQEYFADGVVEEIITALSRFRSLFVIARNSTFTYKGKAVDIRTVSQELGVQYVLEGSVRKAGNRVRITAQLIRADTGAHIWAERYDGDLTDVFDLQDRVAADVVGAIAPRLEQAEIDRAKRKPTENLGAYDCYLRGMASYYLLTAESVDEALRLFYRAIELDPGFALAHGMAALCYQARRARAWSKDLPGEALEVSRLARRALQLDADDAQVLSVSAYALAFVVHDLEIAAKVAARALTLNQNLALAWMASGWVNVWSGTPDVAIDHFARAIRLSPRDSMLHLMHIGMAHAHYMSRRYDDAASWVDKERQEGHGGLAPAMRIAAASAALAGHEEQARKFLARYLQVDPDRRESNLADALGPYARAEDIDHYKAGLRKAGLPQ